MATSKESLKGRKALVTGASGGLGRAISRKLAGLGIDLALHYSSGKEACEQLAESLKDSGVKITLHQANLAVEADVLRLAKEAGPVDILINNAGYGKRVPQIWDITDEDFDLAHLVNVRAPFLLCRALVPHMRDQRWGRLIGIGSIAAYGGGVNGAAYATSKGGIMAMMKNLGLRLAEYNITANDIAPALIGGTNMMPNAQAAFGLADQIPLKRMGEPEEVAAAVEFFITCGFATSQSVLISGGLAHQ